MAPHRGTLYIFFSAHALAERPSDLMLPSGFRVWALRSARGQGSDSHEQVIGRVNTARVSASWRTARRVRWPAVSGSTPDLTGGGQGSDEDMTLNTKGFDHKLIKKYITSLMGLTMLLMQRYNELPALA